MSYQVLARKWRPRRFGELVGQEHVKSTLINALNMGRLHHAYLFTGTRGVGKTTIARIFAKSLNCEQGISAEPCGSCDTCLAIENGHYVDLIEIDAASRTKVEDTREILDNVQYAPTRGRFKVYLIDEVHMLSRHSFNALLKTLEEPPEHVKFLLATTDPQKLPITILSRCLQFNLKALLRSEIATHLEDILSKESIVFDSQAVALLAKAADGSLRDALSLTDQAIAQSAGALELDTVEKMLGTIDKNWSLKLLAHIVNHDGEQLMATVEDIARLMPDYRHLVDQLLSMFHLAAMTQLVPAAAQIDESSHGFVTRLAGRLSAEDIQLYYQLLLNGKKDLELAPDARMGFEMLMLRLLAFKPVPLISRPDGAVVKTEAAESLPVPEIEVPEIEAPEVKTPKTPAFERPSSVNVASTTVQDDLAQAPLDVQQQSVLQQAMDMGFQGESSRVTPDSPVEPTVRAPAKESVVEKTPQALSAPHNDARASQEQDAPSGALPIESSSKHDATDVVEPQAPLHNEIEDPVAAILANRNLSLDSLFGTAENASQAGSAPVQPQAAETPDESEKKKLTEPAPTYLEAAEVFEPQKTQVSQSDPQPEFAQAGSESDFGPNTMGLALQDTSVEPPFEPSNELNTPPQNPAADWAEQHPAQSQQVQPHTEPVAMPADESIPSSESELPRWAYQVDEWAALIESMGLGGLVRLLAVQSVWQKQGKNVTLSVFESEKHLDSSGLRAQLQKALSLTLNEPVELELVFTAEQLDTPLNIQRRIDADRLVRAKALIYQDPIILAMQQQFAAEVDDASIVAL